MNKELWTIDEVQEDVERICKTLAYELAKQAEVDMIKLYDSIVDHFYSRHNPTSHSRKHNLYRAIMKHCTSWRKGGNMYEASVTIGSKGMDEVYRRKGNRDIVFNLWWNEGIRGLPKTATEPLTHDFDWYTPTGYRHWHEGEIWENPFWSGKRGPYHNIYRVNGSDLGVSGVTLADKTPNEMFYNYVDNWDKVSGKKACDEIVKKIRNGN